MTKELIEKKNALITRAEEVLETAKTEERELTDAEAQELAEIKDDVKKIKEQIGLTEEIEELTNEETEEEEMAPIEEKNKDAEVQEKRAFENYLRDKVINERAGELDPAGANGDVVVPETIAKKIISTVYDICPILERSTKYNVKGKLNIPVYGSDGDTNLGIITDYADEFEELTSTTGAFSTIELSGFLAGALTKVSKSLVNNTDFDLVDFVVQKMAESIARFIEHELLIGTENKVEGLSSLTNIVETGASSVITADEIIEAQDGIKSIYQDNAIWIMNSKTKTALKKLTTTTGEYLLNNDISSPFGATILGKPVYVSDNMQDIGAGNVAIYYGDFAGLATKFGEEIDIEVLREKFATQHAVGVVGWIEFDSKVENNQAIVGVQCKA